MPNRAGARRRLGLGGVIGNTGIVTFNPFRIVRGWFRDSAYQQAALPGVFAAAVFVAVALTLAALSATR